MYSYFSYKRIIKNLLFIFNASICLFCRFSAGMELRAFIGTKFKIPYKLQGKEISLQDLALLPEFIRFGEVLLLFFDGSQPIADKCQLFDGCLQSIKSALNDSYSIRFASKVDQNDESHFSNHQTLIEYLRDRLLPICDSSRNYSFGFVFDSDKNSSSSVIASILQMSQTNRCFGVFIGLRGANSAQLPIDTISKWLHRNSAAMEIRQKQKFLHIRSSKTFQNIPEMCNLLKTVHFAFFPNYFLIYKTFTKFSVLFDHFNYNFIIYLFRNLRKTSIQYPIRFNLSRATSMVKHSRAVSKTVLSQTN